RALQEPWQNESARLQTFSALQGAVGRYREAQETFNRAMPPGQVPAPLSSGELEAIRETPMEPAEEMVLDAVRRHQIVLLNETHHQPEHRAFGARLIPRLAALGVKYF